MKLFRLAGVLVLFFLFAYVSLCAETPRLPLKLRSEEIEFKEIRLPGDNPIRGIVSILQDKHGFIWMAGRHGLIRYDGHDYKIFRHIPGDKNSIVDTELLTLYLHCDTLLCIGGMHGISLMDIRTTKTTNLMHDQDGNLVEYINQFYPDKDGTIWMGGLMGLYSLKPDLSGIINHKLKTPPITKGNPAFAKRVYDITENSVNPNRLMLATECGLISYDKVQDTIYKIYPNTKATFWRSQPPVYKIVKKGNYLYNLCWISGLPKFDMVDETWINLGYPKPGDHLTTTKNLFAINDFMFKNEN